jgi:hypothetical protein
MHRQLIFLVASSLMSVATWGQIISADSKGKSVFTHVVGKNLRIESSETEPVAISKFFEYGKTAFTVDSTHLFNKISGVNVRLALRNADKFVSLSQLKKLHPGFGLRIGWHYTIPEFNAIDMMGSTYLSTYTCGLTSIFDVDNIYLYDTRLSSADRELPMTVGAEGNFNMYFRNRGTVKSRWIFATVASIVHTYNDDALISYQELANVTPNGNVIALKDFAGKYGELNEEVVRGRVALSVPFYIGYFNLTPFFVLNSNNLVAPRYHAGLFLNLLQKPLEILNFKIPSTIGGGVDRIMQGGATPVTEWYIRGTLQFD